MASIAKNRYTVETQRHRRTNIVSLFVRDKKTYCLIAECQTLDVYAEQMRKELSDEYNNR